MEIKEEVKTEPIEAQPEPNEGESEGKNAKGKQMMCQNEADVAELEQKIIRQVEVWLLIRLTVCYKQLSINGLN